MSRNMYPTVKHINKSKDQQYIFPLRETNLSNRIHKLSVLTAVDVIASDSDVSKYPPGSPPANLVTKIPNMQLTYLPDLHGNAHRLQPQTNRAVEVRFVLRYSVLECQRKKERKKEKVQTWVPISKMTRAIDCV